MNSVQAGLISTSKDGRHAQVVVYLGEGPQRRSVTCHLHLKSGTWMGYNPDEAAVARLDAAEKALEKVERHHEFLESLAKTTTKEVNEILEAIRRYGENSEVPPVFREAVKKVLLTDQEANAEAVKAFLKREVARSAALLRVARKQAEELRKSIPREVQFSF